MSDDNTNNLIGRNLFDQFAAEANGTAPVVPNDETAQSVCDNSVISADKDENHPSESEDNYFYEGNTTKETPKDWTFYNVTKASDVEVIMDLFGSKTLQDACKEWKSVFDCV